MWSHRLEIFRTFAFFALRLGFTTNAQIFISYAVRDFYTLLFLLMNPSFFRLRSGQAKLRVTVTKRASQLSLPLKTSLVVSPQLSRSSCLLYY
jgi:hypothetical protein